MSVAGEKHPRDPPAANAQTDNGNAPPSEKRVKTEDGVAAPVSSHSSTPAAATLAAPPARKKRRWDATENVNSATAAAAASAAAATAAGTPAAAASSAAVDPQSAATKALALKKSIAERLAAAKIPKISPQTSASSTQVKLESGAPPANFFPSPSVLVKDEKSAPVLALRLDAQGRQIDAEGRLVQMQRPTELMVNSRAQAEKLAAANARPMPHAKIATTIVKEEGMSKYHDPRMPEPKALERKPRGLVMVKPGKYMQMAATMRMKQLEKDLASVSRVGVQAAAAAPVAADILHPGVIPNVEWWDAPLLSDPTTYDCEPNLSRVTHLIYHPVPIPSLTAKPPPPPKPVLLTKKEQKKIKKRTKREMLKEKQDRVRLGLEAPAEPKSQCHTTRRWIDRASSNVSFGSPYVCFSCVFSAHL
jgi:U4/U6 small nuclear ribonucleoprotein PRP3